MTKNPGQKLKFWGKQTGIAITLPVGWHQERQENSQYPTDVYYQTLGEEYSPCITIRVIEVPEDDYHQNNYQELSEIMLSEQAKISNPEPLEILEQLLETIDGHVARIDIFKMLEPETQISITQYQVAVQLKNAICGLVAVIKTEVQDTYMPIITEAIQSMKFNT